MFICVLFTFGRKTLMFQTCDKTKKIGKSIDVSRHILKHPVFRLLFIFQKSSELKKHDCVLKEKLSAVIYTFIPSQRRRS